MKENVRVHNRNKLHRIGAMQREHPTGQHSHHSIQHFHHHDGPFLHSLQGHLHPHEGVALFVDPRNFQTFSLVNPPTQVHADLIVFSDFTDEVGKSFIHINPLLSGSFNELATEVSGKITTL